MDHRLNKITLQTISGTLALLASFALPPAATAQPATGVNATNATKFSEDEKERQEQQKRDVETDRLRAEAMIRQNRERHRALREALQKEQAMLDQPRQLLARLFQVPDTMKLSAESRALAEAALKPQRERAAAAWPAWQEQAITSITGATSNRHTDIEQVALSLSARAVNEAALWFADAEPHPSDTVWVDALRSDGLCQGLSAVEPAARIAALIEALPAERRASAWAGEAARLSRWGQEARTLLPPPERTLEDSLTAALAPATRAKTLASMPAALRAAAQAPGFNPATQAPAERCETLRWWSQEQVRLKRLSTRQAMLAWRTALAARSADFVLAGQARSGAEALDKGGHPLVARRLGLSGKVIVQQDIDATGKALQMFIQRRELGSTSLGSQPPVGLEHELDQASLDRVAAMPLTPPAASTVQDGYATRRVVIEWVVN